MACIAAGAVVVVACAGSVTTSAPDATVAPTAAATTPEPTSAPSRAPLEGQFAFVDGKTASSYDQIFLENADGGNARRLISESYDDDTPRLSPDGRRVLFTRYPPEGQPGSDVFVVNVDGSGLTRVDSAAEDPAWSPDGTQIVVTRAQFDAAGNPSDISLWVMNADGTGARQVTHQPSCPSGVCASGVVGAQDNRAVWSPDGTRLAFTRDLYSSTDQYGIFTVALDGSDLRRVSPEGMNADNPAWSPDGASILFQYPPEPLVHGEQDIFSIHPDGSGLVQLTAHLSASEEGGQGNFHAAWSPDGRYISFSHFPGYRSDRASLFVMNADGSDVHLLAPSEYNQNGVDWGRMPTP
jgi:TolB protein